jgi:hypothetical protein
VLLGNVTLVRARLGEITSSERQGKRKSNTGRIWGPEQKNAPAGRRTRVTCLGARMLPLHERQLHDGTFLTANQVRRLTLMNQHRNKRNK